jgi:hypothetical protein
MERAMGLTMSRTSMLAACSPDTIWRNSAAAASDVPYAVAASSGSAAR